MSLIRSHPNYNKMQIKRRNEWSPSSSFYFSSIPTETMDTIDSGGGKGYFIWAAKSFLLIPEIKRTFLILLLIDPILRTNPDVGKIYVLIKAKDNEAAMKRLKNEVEDTELFRCLQEIHGKNYHSFVLSKQVPVVGNFREANIGIAPELAKEIAEEVDVIVNSAANTTFDERYDVALDINTVGPFRIMSFAQRFRRLKLFLQVSTAYVNGQRQGLILEKPFCLGDTITKGIGSSDFSAHQNTVLDIEAEIKLAFYSRRHSSASASVTQEMKELGSRGILVFPCYFLMAKLYGWQDTYVFTKAMGEMVINCMRGEIPVVTIRPSVIESTWRDPFPGWMEGNRKVVFISLAYGSLRSFPAFRFFGGKLIGIDFRAENELLTYLVLLTYCFPAKRAGPISKAPNFHILGDALSSLKDFSREDETLKMKVFATHTEKGYLCCRPLMTSSKTRSRGTCQERFVTFPMVFERCGLDIGLWADCFLYEPLVIGLSWADYPMCTHLPTKRRGQGYCWSTHESSSVSFRKLLRLAKVIPAHNTISSLLN
ncbi:hypothetical protein ZWY2020_008599 [Hordeum vulgare]|nr:hypothetical protein ZWY2020_008599 [Hordeum vulgare]